MKKDFAIRMKIINSIFTNLGLLLCIFILIMPYLFLGISKESKEIFILLAIILPYPYLFGIDYLEKDEKPVIQGIPLMVIKIILILYSFIVFIGSMLFIIITGIESTY